MGYFFVILSTLSGTAKGYCGKKSSASLSDFSTMLFFNFLRTLGCTLMGLVLIFVNGSRFVWGKGLAIAALGGVSMGVFLLTWLIAVHTSSYVSLDICCQTGSVILPCIFAAPLLGDEPSVGQFLCLALLIPGIVLLTAKPSADKKRLTLSSAAVLAAVWITSGLNSLFNKLYAATPGADSFIYNTVTFAVAALAIGGVCFCCRRKGAALPLQGKVKALYLPIMIVCLYLSGFFMTEAGKTLSAFRIFPLLTGLGLILSTLLSVFCFKEKLTLKNYAGIFLSALSVIGVNLL